MRAWQPTILAAIVASAHVVWPDPPPQGEFPLYVGQEVCLRCHREAGRSCSIEPIPQHARAFTQLSADEARSIAALSGIADDPRHSRICLYCHATAADEGARWTAESFTISDGVQCEACHGAGSLHVDGLRTTGSTDESERDPRIVRGGREDCGRCHVDKPSHRAVGEDGFALQRTDALYKRPVNLTVSPDGRRLYVVCENSNSLLVIDTETESVVAEIPVGQRPHDAAVSPDGETIFVTNRMSGSVSVVSAVGLEVTAEFESGHEPHGLVVGPDGHTILVLNTADDTASVINVESPTELRRLVMGSGPWSVALSQDGQSAFVTSVRPSPGRFRDPPQSEVSVIDVRRGVVSARRIVAGANMLQGITTVPGADVALFTLMRTKNLIPTSRLAQGWTITNGLGVVWPEGRVDQILLDQPGDSLPDLMDVAVSPDGRRAIVVSAGANCVAVIDVRAMLERIRKATDRERAEVLPNHLGQSGTFVVARIPVGTNPRAAVFSPDGRLGYVANALDDTLTVLDPLSGRVLRTISLAGPKEITELRFGERLFHDASNAFGRQFSCRSCHPDGHDNGLTFDIEADGVGLSPVDNRTLRGIFDTPPFKWEGTNPSLHRQCGARLAVFFTRLDPFTPDELDALVKYMATIEQPPNRFREPAGLTLAQRRGKAVFERSVRNNGEPLKPLDRCSTCHSGAYLTNRKRYRVATTMWLDEYVNVDLENLFQSKGFGELGTFYFVDVGEKGDGFDVPHLRNIADSPPYLHNGAARTLEEIWTLYDIADRHGATADLTRQQMNDLIAYLKSL